MQPVTHSVDAVLDQIRSLPQALGLSESSLSVEAGDVFVACATNDETRLQHMETASQAGAVAYVIDAEATPPSHPSLPTFQMNQLAKRRGTLAAKFYADPSQQMTCIGITGTNGKTSIAYHLADLGNRLNVPTGYSGTLGWGAPGALVDSDMTTAPPVLLQRQFAAMAHEGMEQIAIEVSSHALDQDRAQEIHMDIAVFSNLTRDHLDYHGSMQKYAAAKTKLFTNWPLQLAVINSDDELGRKLMTCARAEQILSYGDGGDIAWRAMTAREGMQVSFETPWGRLESMLPLAGEFAVANAAAAIAVLLGSGYAIADLEDALTRLHPVPGRMQVLGKQHGMPKVIVDYAHTPDALDKVLAALCDQVQGRLICIVGCGGNRDKGKRAEMAQVVAARANRAWFTSDNPRDESPEAILQDMLNGLTSQQQRAVHVEQDRASAIALAIQSAGPDDVIVIAGKGHESTQEIDGIKYPFSDAQVAQKIMKENA